MTHINDTNDELDYYLIGRNNQNSPCLDYKDIDEKEIFFEDEDVSEVKKLEMCIRKPKPPKLEMADYHSVASILAFSDRIHAVLEPLKLHKVQFIPASVEIKKDTEIDGYWLMHNYNHVECMDLEKSDCEISPRTGNVSWIRKIVLSPEKLLKVPLEERLFFRMKEDFPTHLVHKSIVDKIMAVNPKGIRFIPVATWKQGMQFDE